VGLGETEDWEYHKAPNGVIPCDDITVNADTGEVEGIYIFNRHMSDFE
jgi:hypothetical protein